ncbi:MAG: transposase family protein [Myxococcales bacterium]|nr:transposase family protein [Myxococcales bacterium]
MEVNNYLSKKKEEIIVQQEQEQSKVIEIFLLTVTHFFSGFKHLFIGINDPRQQHKCNYSLVSLMFVGVLMFITRLGSRRQINHLLRENGPGEMKFQELFQAESLPHGDTLNELFKHIEVAEVQQVVTSMTTTLIHKKILHPYRLFGYYYTIAVDGTGMLTFHQRHCAHCLTRKHKNGTLYYHHVLEAKLVTQTGFAFSLMTEFIENPTLTMTAQDCELKAFYRLSERMKKRLYRLPICLLLDGLFAGGPTFSLCEQNGWKYIVVLTEDDLPTINQEFDALTKISPENSLQIIKDNTPQIMQDFRWVADIAYTHSNKVEHSISVLQCLENKTNNKAEIILSRNKWITNLQLTKNRVAIIANEGGRLRWKIENEGFNIQKNGGFELEHAYSKDINASKVFYFLLQIAHIIFQLMQKGSLFKNAFPKGFGSYKNLAFRLLEAWRNLCSSISSLLDSPRFSIRFDSS